MPYRPRPTMRIDRPSPRSYTRKGKYDAARTLAKQALQAATDMQREPVTLTRLDDTVYRRPDTRKREGGRPKLRIALISKWDKRPKALQKYYENVGIFCLHAHEIDLAYDMDLVLLPDGVTLAPETPFTICGRDSDGPIDWHLMTAQGQASERYTSLSDWLDTAGAKTPETRKKRIMVVANHHFEKWNPHGGERSTRTIVQNLRAAGYDIITVVENKKTADIGQEKSAITDYILFSEYVFHDCLQAAIACWQPDGIISYGRAGLVLGQVCPAMNVPYVMFPRGWPEILPPPYVRTLERHPVSDPDDPSRVLYQNAQTNITNAKYVGKVIKKLYDAPSVNSYVPVLPPPESFTPTPLEERDEILLINARKLNGGRLIRDLAARRPDLKFRVISGDGEPFPNNVTVEPFFDGAHYCEMYKHARLFLFPLDTEDPCGTGRVVFEALHCHTPVLSINRAGMPEVLPEDWLIEEETIDAWLGAIDRMLLETPSATDFETMLKPFHYEDQLKIIEAAITELVKDGE